MKECVKEIRYPEGVVDLKWFLGRALDTQPENYVPYSFLIVSDSHMGVGRPTFVRQYAQDGFYFDESANVFRITGVDKYYIKALSLMTKDQLLNWYEKRDGGITPLSPLTKKHMINTHYVVVSYARSTK